MDKRELRKEMKRAKAQMTAVDKQAEAQRVFAALEQMPQFASAHNVLLYHSLDDELPTHEILERWSQLPGKKIYLPRVNGDSLDVVPLDGALNSDNKFNIAEPQGDAVDASVLDLIVVPAVALDPKGHRLGRGKGFYDRLLTVNHAFTVGVVMECQLVDSVPCEAHDVTLNAVLTSTHLYICNS